MPFWRSGAPRARDSIQPMTARTLTVRTEEWPLSDRFTISRGAKTAAQVVVAELSEAGATGRGECVPYARYGETVEGVVEAIGGVAQALAGGLTRAELQQAMPPGAARNALDCALWDLEAKTGGRRAFVLAGLTTPRPVATAFTLSLDDPQTMAEKARAAARHGLLKLKLGAEGDAERLAAVRAARPRARLIVDANEGWAAADLPALFEACANAGVELIEQPLPAGDDAALERLARPVPVCADESVHDARGLTALARRYDAINVKLDKTGGLTEALRLVEAARAHGLQIMVGCMVATSLAMAPAVLLAQSADVVDLDGPLLLARDREPGLVYDGDRIEPPPPALWG